MCIAAVRIMTMASVRPVYKHPNVNNRVLHDVQAENGCYVRVLHVYCGRANYDHGFREKYGLRVFDVHVPHDLCVYHDAHYAHVCRGGHVYHDDHVCRGGHVFHDDHVCRGGHVFHDDHV